LSKYRFKKDLGVAKWVVPNLYLWRATDISCLDTFKSVIRAFECNQNMAITEMIENERRKAVNNSSE